MQKDSFCFGVVFLLLSWHVRNVGARRFYAILLHPLFEHTAVLRQRFGVCFLHCKVACLATVAVHIVELFAIASLVVEHILEVGRAYRPSQCARSLVKEGFRHYVRLVLCVGVAAFGNVAIGHSTCAFRLVGTCPVAYRGKEVGTVVDELGQLFAGVLLARQHNYHRNVGHFVVKYRLLVPVVGAGAVAHHW